MTITQTQINAVLDWLYNERAVDIQTLSNQDNPTLIGKKYTIDTIVFGNTTSITLSLADIANFEVGQVIKFSSVEDSTLAAELNDLVPEELRIESITGTSMVINFDGSSLTGAFTAGKIINTYNIRVLNYAIKKGILTFESNTGIAFNYESEHHLEYVSTSTLMKLYTRASAEYKGLQEDLTEISKRFGLAKAEFLSSDVAVLDEDNYDMNNRITRADFGISFPSNQEFAD